jgi:hypothetical protein
MKAIFATLAICRLPSAAGDSQEDYIREISGIEYSDDMLKPGFVSNWTVDTYNFGLKSFADIVLTAEDCVAAVLTAITTDIFPDGTAITDESWVEFSDAEIPDVPFIWWPPENGSPRQPWSGMKSGINGVEFWFDNVSKVGDCGGIRAPRQKLDQTFEFGNPNNRAVVFWFDPVAVNNWTLVCVHVFLFLVCLLVHFCRVGHETYHIVVGRTLPFNINCTIFQPPPSFHFSATGTTKTKRPTYHALQHWPCPFSHNHACAKC